MKKIKDLAGKFPVTTSISSAFTAVFVSCGAIGFVFGKSLMEAGLLAGMFAASSGIIAWVKVVDKDNESE